MKHNLIILVNEIRPISSCSCIIKWNNGNINVIGSFYFFSFNTQKHFIKNCLFGKKERGKKGSQQYVPTSPAKANIGKIDDHKAAEVLILLIMFRVRLCLYKHP